MNQMASAKDKDFQQLLVEVCWDRPLHDTTKAKIVPL